MQGEPYSFRTCLLLDNYKLEDKTVGRSGEAGRWNHQWLLADKQNSMAITLYAKSLDAKNKWMRAFSIAMSVTLAFPVSFISFSRHIDGIEWTIFLSNCSGTAKTGSRWIR